MLGEAVQEYIQLRAIDIDSNVKVATQPSITRIPQEYGIRIAHPHDPRHMHCSVAAQACVVIAGASALRLWTQLRVPHAS